MAHVVTNGHGKADRRFAGKLRTALAARDWADVERLFTLYGAYLQLIEPEDRVESSSERGQPGG